MIAAYDAKIEILEDYQKQAASMLNKRGQRIKAGLVTLQNADESLDYYDYRLRLD